MIYACTPPTVKAIVAAFHHLGVWLIGWCVR
jgi:hypothetical protein